MDFPFLLFGGFFESKSTFEIESGKAEKKLTNWFIKIVKNPKSGNLCIKTRGKRRAGVHPSFRLIISGINPMEMI